MQSESRVELIKQMFNCLLILLTLSPPPSFLRPLWLQAQVVSWALCLCPGKLHQGSQHFGKRSLKDHHYWQFTTSLCISGETPTPDMQVLPGYQQASEILTMSRIMKKFFGISFVCPSTMNWILLGFIPEYLAQKSTWTQVIVEQNFKYGSTLNVNVFFWYITWNVSNTVKLTVCIKKGT